MYSCYEALSLEMAHPSVAFLIYVAAIEGIARMENLCRCRECGCNTGARRRFREALKMVLPPDEVKMLADVAHGVRVQDGT